MPINDVRITVTGNLTDDPELRYTPSGQPVATFTVANNPRYYDRDAQDWKDGDPNFYRVNVWRSLAENVADSFHRGMGVIVTGTMAMRTWEDNDGNKRVTWEVTGQAAGPDLTWVTAKISRATRDNAPPPDDREQRSRDDYSADDEAAEPSGKGSPGKSPRGSQNSRQPTRAGSRRQ